MTPDPSTPDPRQDPQGPEGTPDTSRFSFSDKRRVDPTDGSVRPSGPAGQGATEGVDPIDAEAAKLYAADAAGRDDRVAGLEHRVAELEEELKRSQAEYVNSRRRIEASAAAATEAAAGRVLGSLVSVLDDIELSRKHGDLAEGTPFGAIAHKLEDALRSHGLERYGAEGEEFDPNRHEALMHEDFDEVPVNTVKTVLQPGYRVKDRILRPARVATRGPQ